MAGEAVKLTFRSAGNRGKYRLQLVCDALDGEGEKALVL